MATELTSRERIWRILRHQEADRVGIMDSPWSTTLARWHREGLPATPAPGIVFGYDMTEIRPDTTLRLPVLTLEETDEYTIVRDSYGTTVKNWKHATSTPGWLGHTIKTRADWEEHKGRTRWESDRVNWEAARRAYEEGRARGLFIYYAGAISWDATLPMIGAEAMLYAMADDPAWIHEMYQAMADLYLAGAEEMLGAGFEFDGAWVYDDMAYRSGPFFSPRMYQEFFFAHDKRVCDFFKARHMPVILHSCGRVTKLIPKLIEAGYACLQPLEVKAGMDVVELKKEFGQSLAFMGGIDVRKMADPNPAAIEQEIAAKVPAAMQGGGYIYHSDHSVPDNVSLDQYRRVLELVRHYGRYNGQ
jgi:uroporphyrinogen decarboxylase